MKKIVIVLIRAYQATYPVRDVFVRMFVDPDALECRFTPTCSDYTIQALEKYGALKGSWLGIRRIVKCHPRHPGGDDPLL